MKRCNPQDIRSIFERRHEQQTEREQQFTYYQNTTSQRLTVIIGAKCSNGMVIIGDTRLSWESSGYAGEGRKVTGDLAHHIVGYAGSEWSFEVFRRYVVGDSIVEKENSYTLDNIISKICENVKKINCELVPYDTNYAFEILFGRHLFKINEFELYAVNIDGRHQKGNFLTIGSGCETAQRLLGKLDHSKLSMKEFMKHAYFAIKFMENYYPSMGVGVKNNDPYVSYMPYDEEWDIPPPNNDMTEARKFAYDEIRKIDDRMNPCPDS